MTGRARRGWALATIAAWAGWSFAMDRHTDAAVPWIDGAITMLSITAQWLLARRRVESWLLWIIVDLIAVPLFASRSEEHTSELQSLMRISYAVFCLKKTKTQNTHKPNKQSI